MTPMTTRELEAVEDFLETMLAAGTAILAWSKRCEQADIQPEDLPDCVMKEFDTTVNAVGGAVAHIGGHQNWSPHKVMEAFAQIMPEEMIAEVKDSPQFQLALREHERRKEEDDAG